MSQVEFVWSASTSRGQVPIPGLTTGVLSGNRYRSQQCQHDLIPNGQHGPDVCVNCNIVIGECQESPQ
jgi:hypothetical protein